MIMAASLQQLLRIIRVTGLFARRGAGLFLRHRGWITGGPSGPDRLRRLLEEIGGTYIKFGQILSLQPDVIPDEYCHALFDLLDRVPPFEYSEVEKTFREDHGKGPLEMFDFFDQVPIASASIGQVHVASLGGRKLAVKVRRPNVVRDFAADLRMMKALANLIEMLGIKRWYWLVRAIREFDSWTHEELDYHYEARFMSALAYNARDNSLEAVPEVLHQYTTPRILVAEYLDGPMVLDYIRSLEAGDPEFERRLQASGFDALEYARNIVRNFVSDAFHHGIFHADLHPANLIILPGNVVGYVDFGITGSLSPYSRRNLTSLTLALTSADIDSMMVHFLRIATVSRDSEIEKFREGLRELIEEWFEEDSGEPKLRRSFTMVMLDMLQLSRKTDIWPTPDVVRYLRSVITSDSLIKRFAPQLDVDRYLQEICRNYLRKEIWREWLTIENLADWTSTGLQLLTRGPAAINTLLKRITESSSPRLEGKRSDRDGRRQSLLTQATQLALFFLVSGLLAWHAGYQSGFGFNLFTLEMGCTGASGILLLRTITRIVIYYDMNKLPGKGDR